MSIDYIISRVKNEDIPLVQKAYDFAKVKLSGLSDENKKTLINNMLEVTNTLIDFNADVLTLVSSILYETLNYGVSKEEIEKEFGASSANICLGEAIVNNLEIKSDIDNSINYFKGLNSDSPEDVRILFIKLADKYHKMKTMEKLPLEYQKKVAQDTMDILVPCAHRIGLNYIKSKLEDLCLYYLDNEAYNEILKKLNEPLIVLNMNLNSMKENISSLLKDKGIKFQIKSRVKSIYSIYNKLMSGKKWEDIYDILAIRIIVDNVSDCYKIIELIHSQYTKVPCRFKDYINFPKENMYQSVHTTIIGDANRFYEIQVRTDEMNKTAEKGTASHHLYKEKKLKKNKQCFL